MPFDKKINNFSQTSISLFNGTTPSEPSVKLESTKENFTFNIFEWDAFIWGQVVGNVKLFSTIFTHLSVIIINDNWNKIAVAKVDLGIKKHKFAKSGADVINKILEWHK